MDWRDTEEWHNIQDSHRTKMRISCYSSEELWKFYLPSSKKTSITSGTKKWCRNFGQCTTIFLCLSFTFRVAACERLQHKVGEFLIKMGLQNMSDLTQATNGHQQRWRWSSVTKTWATNHTFISNFDVPTFVLMLTQVFGDMIVC